MRTKTKVGTCGFPLSKAKLAEVVSVAEVQQTFYQPPMLRTLERWRSEVPEDFEFTVKAWQLITHLATSPTYRRLSPRVDRTHIHDAGSFQDTRLVHDAWRVTRECCEALRADKVLFQCPPSFTPTDTNVDSLREFFKRIDRANLTVLWEPRGEWPLGLVSEVITDLDLVHVVDPFTSKTVSDRLHYYRLHGIGGYRYQYSDDELRYLASLLDPCVETYVMFNNSALLEDALRFRRLIEK